MRSRAPGAHAHGNTERQVVDRLRTEVCGQQKQSNDLQNNHHNPRYSNDWAPRTRKRHIPPHPAQPWHTNDWAPRMRKRHQQEHRPQRPTERSDPTQHAKGRTGDCPGPRKETTTGRNVTRGVPPPLPIRFVHLLSSFFLSLGGGGGRHPPAPCRLFAAPSQAPLCRPPRIVPCHRQRSPPGAGG